MTVPPIALTQDPPNACSSPRGQVNPAGCCRGRRPAPHQPPTGRSLAGTGYVLIFALAILASFLVLEGLVEPGDAAATAENVRGSLGLFRLGLIAFLVVFLLDIVVAWALHLVFRQTHHDLSLLAAWSRLVYTAFLGVGLVHYARAMQLLGGDDLDSPASARAASQALLALESFETTWLIGLAAFGLHLVLLGGLAPRSGIVPRLLSVLLVTAGGAYTIDTVAHLTLPDYEQYAALLLALVAVPSVLGEGWLGLWLLRTRRLACWSRTSMSAPQG